MAAIVEERRRDKGARICRAAWRTCEAVVVVVNVVDDVAVVVVVVVVDEQGRGNMRTDTPTT